MKERNVLTNVKRILKVFSLFLFLVFTPPIFSQETSTITQVLGDYPDLLMEYEELLTDYEEVITDYSNLLDEFIDLDGRYSTLLVSHNELKKDFENIVALYNAEIEEKERVVKLLNEAKETISLLEGRVEDLLSFTDSRYFTLYAHGGYNGNSFTTGLSFSARVPEIPLSFILGFDYLPQQEFPINVNLGIGFRF